MPEHWRGSATWELPRIWTDGRKASFAFGQKQSHEQVANPARSFFVCLFVRRLIVGMHCECGEEVTEDFDCPKCRVGDGDRFVFRLFVQIPAKVDTDFTDEIWMSKEAELADIVGKPIGDRGMYVQGSFDADTSSPESIVDLTRDYWFDRLTFEQAKAAKQGVEAKGWIATIREH